MWALDEYAQRDRFNGTPRFGFGPYPPEERAYDLRNAPDESRLVQQSIVIAAYAGDDARAVRTQR